jgi:beta-N-acetylhexosaminidase
MVKKVFLVLLVVSGVLVRLNAQSHKTHWVDSVFNSLSIEERIGQLFMVNVPPHPSADALKEIEDEIKSHEI